MTIQEAIRERHSVRKYRDVPIKEEILEQLREEIRLCNEEGDLHIQLVTKEPQAFSSRLAHYGSFSGVKNYIALVGKKGDNPEEKCGYYGERIVLKAQMLGLNTCWAALTFKKIPGAFTVAENEKFVMVIAVGYGENKGTSHKVKTIGQLCQTDGEMPDWFRRGAEAAQLAPTAVNQQKFRFILDGNTVEGKAGIGFCTKTDLGIAKYHFEIGAGKENFTWK